MVPACVSNRCRSGKLPCPTPEQCVAHVPWIEPEEIRTPMVARIARAFFLAIAVGCGAAFLVSILS